jgi:energy-coupling factor transporter ATP-binding protein EcfA2
MDGVSFRYPKGGAVVFRDADFSFEPGRPYILKAPNGAGKSTFAKLLAGVLQPNSGRIVVGGAPHVPSSSTTNLLFYAFQQPIEQFFGNTVEDYLSKLYRRAQIRPTFLRGDSWTTPAEVLDGFGLASFGGTEPFDLPSFVAKRLSIVASLLSRSPWLFFDEPSFLSDVYGREALASLFGTLCENGYGVVIVSHGSEFDDMPGARLITISSGRIVSVREEH